MFDIVLYEPEIPPNTGNAVRLAANTGTRLHLVKPLGFNLGDKQLLRAGLDYSELASVCVHEDWDACRARFASRRIFALTTGGSMRYDAPSYSADDVFLFGAGNARAAAARSRRIRPRAAHPHSPACR